MSFYGEGGKEGGRRRRYRAAPGLGSLPLCGEVRAAAPDSGFFSGSWPTFPLKSYQARRLRGPGASGGSGWASWAGGGPGGRGEASALREHGQASGCQDGEPRRALAALASGRDTSPGSLTPQAGLTVAGEPFPHSPPWLNPPPSEESS